MVATERCLLFWILVAGAGLARADDIEEMSATRILEKVDDLYRGESARGEMRMKVVTAHWTRELEMEFWARGEEKTLIRILSPKKEKGTATLKNGEKIYNYLPKVNKVIHVPSSMMSSSWMGSHFTNNDLVKEARMSDDYDATISFRGRRDGEQVVELTCKPKPDAPVVWDRVVVTVGAEHVLPRKVAYHGQDGDLARTLSFTDVGRMGGRRLPATMRMQPADKPDEYTEVHYEEVEFDASIPKDKFTLRALRH